MAVIGAGPAGLTAAVTLQRSGHDVTLFEASDEVGGMARTLEMWGRRADLGPHRFFSADPEVNRFWLSFAGEDCRTITRRTRILFGDTLLRYPLEPADLVRCLPAWEVLGFGGSWARERLFPGGGDPGSLEGWMVSRFGRRLYERFFKGYSEKLWGLPCAEIDADFAAQRIRQFSLGVALRSLLRPESAQGHLTLADRFAYPDQGAGAVYREMARVFAGVGGVIRRGARVTGVRVARRRVAALRTNDGGEQACDCVVSTMPLPALLRALTATPRSVLEEAGRLRFRNTIIVFLLLTGSDYFPDNWLYAQTPDLGTGRIANFRNWSAGLHGGRPGTVLSLEYWCNSADAAWSSGDAAHVAAARRDLERSGLAPAGDVLDARVERLRGSYPVYERGYRRRVERVADHLSGVANLFCIGRGGAFRYNNQDHSILMGLVAARAIVAGRSSCEELWSVNTDYLAYHEQPRLEDVGLPGTAVA